MRLLVDNITLSPDQPEELLGAAVRKELALTENPTVRIHRKSLDARKKDSIVWRYRLVIEVDELTGQALLNREGITAFPEIQEPAVPATRGDSSVIVVGAGPAGLFAALRLSRAGIRVTLLERGKPVEDRMRDISVLEEKGRLDPESNVLFGEGGAGTYSDGKLTARTRKPESEWFFREMISSGAGPEVAYMSKPHVGSDRLRVIVSEIRKSIECMGSVVRFGTRADDLLMEGDRCAGIVTSGGEELRSDAVILAMGHSARDTYYRLQERGVAMERKGSAVGLRVEHPAELIRSIQYGSSKYRDILPPAEYSVSSNNLKTGRGIYSFCMCPGGAVINSSSESGMLCVNGMSDSVRDSQWSNAALVVTVGPEDYGPGVLAGLEFQRRIESAACGSGGGGYRAPAQRLTSFLKNRRDSSLPSCSYRPGVRACPVSDYLPEFIVSELKNALHAFDRRMKGFITGEALLVGAETRTSSPVRILRDGAFQSVSVRGLYPAGEGAGYAGGIVSSAVDGICVADAVMKSLL